MIYSIPKFFNHNHIEKFLDKLGHFFLSKNQNVPGITLDGSKINDLSLVGILIIYKFMEYSVVNKCFFEPVFRTGYEFERSIDLYGFEDLIQSLINGEINSRKQKNIYSNFNVQVTENFFIAPHIMQRENPKSYTDFERDYTSKVSNYYGFQEIKKEMILNCISEILLNFWEHAELDKTSILVAEGNQSKIEIACADTGNGIISTLKERYSELTSWENGRIINFATQKNVTSKPDTFHMGRGLWILKEIAKQTGGTLLIYSQGGAYKFINNKELIINCGHWGGTLIYLNLPLHNPVNMADILVYENEKLNNIKLNLIN